MLFANRALIIPISYTLALIETKQPQHENKFYKIRVPHIAGCNLHG